MSNKAFISAVSYDEAIDAINVSVSTANQTIAGKAYIQFGERGSVNTSLSETIVDALDQLPYTNAAVFTAAIIATLHRHTDEETKIPLVIDVNEPIEIELY